jgi:hypothetical protein
MKSVSPSATTGSYLLAACAILLLAGMELWIGLQLLQRRTQPADLLPMHTAAAFIAILTQFTLRKSLGRRPMVQMFLATTIFLGPLGVLGTAVAALLEQGFAWRARPFSEWYDALFPPADADQTRALYESVVLHGHGPMERSTVAPFADVIALGSLEEKRAAIALMAGRFRPEFAPALQAALNDREPAIRVQAASAVARIEHRFLQRSMKLEECRLARPNDPDLLMETARHHEELAATGLIDEGRAREAVRLAVSLHLRLISMHAPHRQDSVAAVGRLLLRLDHFEEAARLLAPAASRVGAPPAIVEPYLESLFQLHRFAELRDFCQRVRPQHDDRFCDASKAAIQLWSENAAPTLLQEASK